MKKYLERFDHSPLWIRLVILAVLVITLITGMVLVQRQSQTSQTAASSSARSSSKSSSSSKKDPVREAEIKAEEEAVKAAEKAVKQYEVLQTDDKLEAAQLALEEVKDEETKAKFQARLETAASQIYYDYTEQPLYEEPADAGLDQTQTVTDPAAPADGQVQE